MSEQPTNPEPSAAAIRDNLRELAQLLRRGEGLDRQSQRQLVELVAELSEALEAGQLSPPVNAHLADSTSHLIEGLRHRHKGLLTAARERLQEAAAAAEVQAPVATGLVERLIDVLSSIGI